MPASTEWPEEPSYDSVAFLDHRQVMALSRHESYSRWRKLRGMVRNLSDAREISREPIRYSEFLELEIASNGEPSFSALPIMLLVPIIGRLCLSYEIGEARHSYIANRMNKDTAQFSFTALVGKSRIWICSSESNCRVFGRAVARLLSDNEVCGQILDLCSSGDSQHETSEVFKEFSEKIMFELEDHALACRERDERIQNVMSEYDGHYNVLAFQKSWQDSKHGYLTDDDLPDVKE